MTHPLLEQSLGQIAREIPGATAVFHAHRLDFCCAGQQTLALAVEHNRLDAQSLVRELADLQYSPTDHQSWTQAADEVLIEHILTRYHDRHRQQLPELIRLAARVERVHGGHPACPAGLTDHLERMHLDLAAHMQKEEQILFPMIARGIRGMAVDPIHVMRREHESHGEGLERLRALTDDMAPPDNACNTWRALYLGLEELVTDLMDHIHLENNVLFERIDGRRPEVAKAEEQRDEGTCCGSCGGHSPA